MSSPGLSAAGVDLTRLPIGDGKVSTQALAGSVFACSTRFGGPGAIASGGWLREDGSFDYTAKPTVDGEVSWPHSFTVSVEGDKRVITSNDLPNHTTGHYPVASSDDAYAFDRNPNTIKAQTFRLELARVPELASAPSCLPMGAVGILLSGSVFYNALDAGGRDAVAHEIQDHCQGHPERSGSYHYHNLTDCLKDPGTGHSELVGYALDGFGIYGHRGENGKVLNNADLDACHGHSHELNWDGQLRTIYHYHATWEYPYTVGCFRGKPVTVAGMQSASPAQGQGQPSRPGPPGPPPR